MSNTLRFQWGDAWSARRGGAAVRRRLLVGRSIGRATVTSRETAAERKLARLILGWWNLKLGYVTFQRLGSNAGAAMGAKA